MTFHKIQVVVPFYKVPKKFLSSSETKKQLNEEGWREFKIGEKIEGHWSPRYGSVRHTAVVEALIDNSGKIRKIEKFLYDQFERADGPLKKPYAHATPNAFLVVLEETDSGKILVQSVKEWRPFIYNYRTKKKGVYVTGVTGKWAKKLGENPAKVALKGIISDMGIEVEKSSLIEIGMHTPNRAWVETCNVVYVAKFKRKIPRQSDKTFDIVEEGKVFPLGEFPPGLDALVNSALWMVARYFGCVSSVPLASKSHFSSKV